MISLLSLIVLAATAVVVFGVRSLLQLRRTGDTGWRSPARSADPVQWWSRLVMGAGFLALLAAPVLDLSGVLPLLFGPTGLRVAGLMVAILAGMAILVAQIGLGPSWRIGVDPDERTGLVTAGPFALVRNPIFTAMLVFCAGQVLAVPNVPAIAGLVFAFAGVEWQVRAVEEPHLRRNHGNSYAAYTATVGRFLPGIGRLRRPLH